jgi:hypothetical protein
MSGFLDFLFSINGLALIGGVLFFIWWFFFRDTQKINVWIEMYQLQGERLIRLNPKGNTKAYIKNDKGIHMLFLPKKYNIDKKGVEIPKAQEYIPNFAGVPLLKVVKINEGEFKLLKHDTIVEEEEIDSQYTVLDRDISFWAQNQADRIDIDYKNESMWDKIKPFATLVVVGFICFLMVYATIDKVNEMALEAAGERKETINLIQNFIDAQRGSSIETQEVETDAPRPPNTGNG